MDFAELRDRILAAYGDGSYSDALDLIVRFRSEFSDRDPTLTFWEACLLSLSGEPEEALHVLQSGLDRGLSWHTRKLADPDLDAAKSLRDWADFESRSSAKLASQTLKRPEPVITHRPHAEGTVIALHGAGQVPADFNAEWLATIPDGWLVVAPVGDVPVSDTGWAWPFDWSTDSLVEALQPIELVEPIVLVGFSQGGGLAARAAWDGAVEAAGVVVFGATLPLTMWSGSKRRPVPMYAVVGTEDGAHTRCAAVASQLEHDGVPVHLDVRDGLGHEPPGDLAATLHTALDWIGSQIGRS